MGRFKTFFASKTGRKWATRFQTPEPTDEPELVEPLALLGAHGYFNYVLKEEYFEPGRPDADW